MVLVKILKALFRRKQKFLVPFLIANKPSTLQKHQFEKVAKLTFFQNCKSMVLVKSLKFLHPSCFGQISLENVFGAVLDGKQAILDK